MKVKLKKLLMNKVLFSLLCFFSVNMFSQSPWVNPKGSLYTQLSYTFLKYNTVVDNSGEASPLTDYVSDFTISSYTEYSLSDRTAIQLVIPFKMVGFGNRTKNGFGDIELGGKTELFKKDSPLTAYYILGLPSSSRENAASHVREYLNTGYNKLSLELGLSSGFAVEKYYSYLNAGYRLRNDISDQFVFGFEAARKFMPKERELYVALSLSGAINTSSNIGGDSLMLYHNDASYVVPGLKAMYNVKGGFWMSASVRGFGLYAKNLGSAPPLTIGVAYKLDK